MPIDEAVTDRLRTEFGRRERAEFNGDYLLLERCEDGYAAVARDGTPAFVLPIEHIPPGAVGRRTEGCELLAHPSARFVENGSQKSLGAAVILCRDVRLLDAYLVLALDVLEATRVDRSWRAVVEAVERWLALLLPKGTPSEELELGLFGELWFLVRGEGPLRLLEGWLGPDKDSTDFFVDGIGVEVKTSKVAHRHFVSQAQVDRPLGDFPAWLLSIWAKAAPGSKSRSVPSLVDELLARASNPAEALQRILRAGYSPGDRAAYSRTFVVVEEPIWFRSEDIPRVRKADPGVSQLRYCVTLERALRADAAAANRLWSHFHDLAYSP